MGVLGVDMDMAGLNALVAQPTGYTLSTTTVGTKVRQGGNALPRFALHKAASCANAPPHVPATCAALCMADELTPDAQCLP